MQQKIIVTAKLSVPDFASLRNKNLQQLPFIAITVIVVFDKEGTHLLNQLFRIYSTINQTT